MNEPALPVRCHHKDKGPLRDEASMTRPFNHFRPAFEALKAGHLSVADALPLAKEHLQEALKLLHDALKDIPDPCPPAVNSWPWCLLDLLWQIYRPSDCISLHFVGISQLLVTHFYVFKLKENPGVLPEHSLVTLSEYCEDNPHAQPLKDLVDKMMADRLKPRAKALLENSQQIKNDIIEVKKLVSMYSFPAALNQLLDKVESELHAPSDGFDDAATLKHLRTFYEHLHQHVGEKLRHVKPDTIDGTDLSRCGQALDFLKRKGVLKETMFDFGKALYGVLSNEGVHAISTPREYVRLCRNMTAEYALVLFFELERRIK